MKNKELVQSFPVAELARLAAEFVSEGKEVVIWAKGSSMKPLLRDGKDKIILSAFSEINIGDVVLYKRETGMYVIHRIVGMTPDGYELLGDYQTFTEKGIKKEQIIAKAVGYIRNGKELPIDSKAVLIYEKIWCNTLTFRKLYFFFYYRLASLKREIFKNAR